MQCDQRKKSGSMNGPLSMLSEMDWVHLRSDLKTLNTLNVLGGF